MWKTILIAVSIVAFASLSPAQDLIFADGFEWGSICAWSNLWYVDSDGDGWGAMGTAGIPVSCPPPGGYAPNQGDCDDINPLINPGEDELCDLIDNDCDPTTEAGIDEPWFGEPCDGLDTDLCEEGSFECTDAMQVCSDESDDNIEMCNTIDDDCNPATPDGVGELWFGDPCDGLDTDLCEEGAFECTDAVQVCSDESDDNIEICNTFDDDCNPATPDGTGEPWFGDPCDGIDGDLCEEGVSFCDGGNQSCDDETGDLLDVCDGFDNDCDPTSADGSEDPLNGAGCDTGMLGICAPGTTQCLAASLTCEQDTFPTGEICDGLDNDCDGTTDEGNPGGGAGCDTGLLGICAPGVTLCTGGALICDQLFFPRIELCDGLDNDCDGTPDDGNPGGGVGCDTGLLGVCALGTTNCFSGALQCDQIQEPTPEICDDFVDNDCNGEADCDDASCDFDPACEPR